MPNSESDDLEERKITTGYLDLVYLFHKLWDMS